jgi:hypothetical protein
MQNNEDIPIWLREASAAIIEHMNDDHCASIKEYKEALIKHAHEYKNCEVPSA